MNVRTNYPFDAAVVRRFRYENAVFVVLLTGKPFFRHTDPAQASAAIAFSPFPASPAFSASASAGLHTPEAAAIPVYGWPESRSSAPS